MRPALALLFLITLSSARARAGVCDDGACGAQTLEPAVTFDTAEPVVASPVLGDATYLLFASAPKTRVARLSSDLRLWPTLPGTPIRPVPPDGHTLFAVADPQRERLLVLRQHDVSGSVLRPVLQTEVLALSPDGSPDTHFGRFGRVAVGAHKELPTTRFEWRHQALALDGAGNIWVATPWILPGESTGVLRVARASAGGFAHTDFGPNTSGMAEHPIAAERVEWTGLFPLKKGGALAIVIAPTHTYVLKLRGDGGLDDSYGSAGVTQVGSRKDAPDAWRRWPFSARAAVRQGDRLILAGIGAEQRIAAIALTAAGEPDATFARGGYFELDVLTGTSQVAPFVFADEAGDLVLMGHAKSSARRHVFVARLEANGWLDKTHGAGGVALYDVDGFSDFIPSAAFRSSDGELALVARTLPNARRDQSFVVRIPARAAAPPPSAARERAADAGTQSVAAPPPPKPVLSYPAIPDVSEPADAEVASDKRSALYIWEDASGTSQVTDDLAKIPPRFRAGARKL